MPATLSPGAGFGGATTPDPAGPIGSGRFNDCLAIARWNRALFQTISTSFVLGVVAFHGSGIDYVEFILDGGTPVLVSSMELNPDTGCWEYCVTIDASALDDGAHEVRAFAYGNKGYPRQLQGVLDGNAPARSRGEHSFWFYSNADTTLPTHTVWCATTGDDVTGDGTEGDPFRTISVAFVEGTAAMSNAPSGLTIMLKDAGSYGWPNCFTTYENTRFVTIAGNPSLAKTACIIDTKDSPDARGLQCRRVALRNLTLRTPATSDTAGCFAATFGCDISTLDNEDNLDSFPAGAWALGIEHENVHVHTMNTALSGVKLAVNYEVNDITEDCIRDPQGFFTNGYVHDTYQPGDNHSDLIQFFSGRGDNDEFENTCFFGLRTLNVGTATEGVQGIFWRNLFAVGTHQDLAFVNCDVGAAGNSQGLHSANHVLFYHCNFHKNPVAGIGGAWLFADDPPDSPDTEVSNLSIRNCVATSFSVDCTTDPLYSDPTGTEVWADNNHFIDNAAGTNNTTGETEAALYTDPSTNDWTPKVGGTLEARTSSLLVPIDANGAERVVPGAIGAYESGSASPTTWYHFSAGGLTYFVRTG